MSKQHKQVPVKVTAFVDKGIAGVVIALNDIKGVSTFSSCEGTVGKECAHIYFDFSYQHSRYWIKLARLAEKLARILAANRIYDATVSLEWTGDSANPFISLQFEPQIIPLIARIISDHRRELADDT